MGKRVRTRRRIAPRLLSGDSRLAVALNLPDTVKAGLRDIADHETESVSWVLEQAILDYFGLKRPKYRIPVTWKELHRRATEAS